MRFFRWRYSSYLLKSLIKWERKISTDPQLETTFSPDFLSLNEKLLYNNETLFSNERLVFYILIILYLKNCSFVSRFSRNIPHIAGCNIYGVLLFMALIGHNLWHYLENVANNKTWVDFVSLKSRGSLHGDKSRHVRSHGNKSRDLMSREHAPQPYTAAIF